MIQNALGNPDRLSIFQGSAGSYPQGYPGIIREKFRSVYVVKGV